MKINTQPKTSIPLTFIYFSLRPFIAVTRDSAIWCRCHKSSAIEAFNLPKVMQKHYKLVHGFYAVWRKKYQRANGEEILFNAPQCTVHWLFKEGNTLKNIFPFNLLEPFVSVLDLFTVGALWCSGSRSRPVIRGSCVLIQGILSTIISLDPGVVNGYPAGIYSFKCTAPQGYRGSSRGNNNTSTLSIFIDGYMCAI